jgi:hypothetical protein
MTPERGPIRKTRSKKAGRPPEPQAGSPRVRRRQKTAQAAVRKDTTWQQPAVEPRARWPAARPKYPKR